MAAGSALRLPTERLLVIQPADPRWGGNPLAVERLRDEGALRVGLGLALEPGHNGVARAVLPAPPRELGALSLPDRAVMFAPSQPVDLEGRRVELPGLFPLAEWVDASLERTVPLPLVPEAAWLDETGLVLVWRGAFEPGGAHDRLLLTLEDGAARDREARLGDRARARVRFAVEPGAAATDLDEAVLALARAPLLAHRPEPESSIERYAAIAAELAEALGPDERGRVLARHGFDEDRWTLEERAWLEKMADDAQRGDVTVAVAFGEAFVAAQDALAPADELDAMLHEYVAIAVRLETAEDPQAIFAGWGLTVASWLRLERHWRRRLEDPAVAAEVKRQMAAERERWEAERASPGEDP